MARQVRETNRRPSRATSGASREDTYEEKSRDANEVMLKSKTVRKQKAKGYDLNEVETGRVKIGEDLSRLLEKLADDKPVVRSNNKDEPEVTILRRREAGRGEDSLKEKQPDDKEIEQTLVEKIPEKY